MFYIVRAVRLLRLLPRAVRGRRVRGGGLPRGVGRLGLTERESGPFPSMYWWRAGAASHQGWRSRAAASPAGHHRLPGAAGLRLRRAAGLGHGGGAAHPRRGGRTVASVWAGRPGQRLPVRPGGGDVLVVVGALQAPGLAWWTTVRGGCGEGLLRPAAADAPCGADPVAAGARRPRRAARLPGLAGRAPPARPVRLALRPWRKSPGSRCRT